MAKTVYTPSPIPQIAGSERRFLADELQKLARGIGMCLVGPTTATEYSYKGFLSLFTAAERASMATTTDATIAQWRLIWASYPYIDRTDAETDAVLNAFVSLGFISGPRKAEIMAGVVKS